MSNHTIHPYPLACRGSRWGAGTPTFWRDEQGRPVNSQTDNPSSGGGSDLRVSDADRQATTDQLKAAFAAGRLDMDEYEERLQQALAAKTRRDLDDLVRDLPPANITAPKPSRGRPLFAPIFMAVAVILALTLAVGVAHGFFFPWWIIPVAFFVLSRRWRRRWYPT
jgi:Domain of unknown function (DUF1707)